MKEIAIISAVAENGVIGANNDMPWSVSTDLKFFRKTTVGKPVIMGRRTFESICATLGKPLPKRTNIIVTRDQTFTYDGVEVVNSLGDALTLANDIAENDGVDEIMIVGGGQIYNKAMPKASTLYITRIHAEPDGDTNFPDIHENDWEMVERTPFVRGEKDSADSSLEVYRRRV
ncbi:Dihydrofolate reductase type 3 [Pseudovibrio axinellae]|uniref:Dihydrofolate reductase n=1 Tax=Pseudovibrio axinellae TaxID=989403 RepID=A0A166AR52_9HYPH|nr:dihydrofolate reductase [Pseudovibrio axinellae]KZL21450.1 Dihydrofolate reductase type 3 [Pseudovibrio axinellae]SER05746.1 dihydrofolate reductase [Pseudovibrio axinellae]